MNEYIIFIGIAFWLVYLSTTYENDWIRLFLKLFSVVIVMLVSYIPLIEVNAADKFGMYELFAFAMMSGLIFFIGLLFVIYLYELFLFFLDRKKKRLEETQ